MVGAAIALAAAALAAGVSPWEPTWWTAAVQLAILGGITPMIYAVNIRLVPMFARRQWVEPRMLVAQVTTGAAGAWLAFMGTGLREVALQRAGHLLAFGGGLLFMVNIVRLFRQRAAIPAAVADRNEIQQAVDRIATRFTRFSGTMLVLGLAIGVVLTWWRPAQGRWELVWAHTLLVGFFLTMAAGVCYHVLPRWTGTTWPSVARIALHLRLVAVSLPVMLVALATDSDWLFLIGGPLQAVAITLFLVNVLPLVWRLQGPLRVGIVAAGLFLIAGVGLGVAFAIDPALGARLRQTHATTNLFGWGGLLISAFGRRFLPGFAGRELRWPWLSRVQVATLLVGAVGGAGAMAWRALGDGPDAAVLAAQAIMAAGMLLFAAQVGGTFAGSPPPEPVVLIRPRPATPNVAHPAPQRA